MAYKDVLRYKTLTRQSSFSEFPAICMVFPFEECLPIISWDHIPL